MMDKLSDILTRHGRWLAIVAILSVMLPALWLPKARIDNSIEVWIGRHSKEYSQYRDFLSRFGNEEFVVIARETDDPLGEEALTLQRSLCKELRQIENVETVMAPCDLADVLSRLVPNWKVFLEQSEFPNNLFFSKNHNTFGIIVWLKKIDTPALRRKTVEEIESVVRDNSPTMENVHLAGTPLMNVALDRGSQQASRTFLPIALLVSVLILAVVLRNLSGVIAVICSVAVTTLWTLGLLVAFGKTLNMVTVILPSLLFVLSLSGGIHIALRFLLICASKQDRAAAMRKTLKEVSLPICLSNLTTAVGFGSLMISDMRPVIDFGIFAAIGIALSLPVNLLVVPGLLLLLPSRIANVSSSSKHWTSWISVWMVDKKKIVLGISGILLILCISWATRAHVESNVLKFFPETSNISRDYKFIGENLTGLYTVEIEFVTPTQNVRQMFKNMEQISEQLYGESQVAKIIHAGSIAAFIKSIHRPAFLSPSQTRKNPLNTLMGHYQIRKQQQTNLRMSVFIRAMSSNQFYELIERIHILLAQNLDDQTEYTVTGVVPLLNAAQQSLINTQIKSFSLALAVVLLLIGLFMKSLRALAAAILPNILPIFALFSIMLLADIPIDAATVMIASVAIGIAADDTIHFLSHFRIHRLSGEQIIPAIRTTFEEIGPAVTLTSVVATSGFLILYMSQFKPVRYFGLLAAITMITAWLGDVFILPACAAILNLWKPHPMEDSANE
ncbi:MAG: MMPL family transporter [Sedimentisphaerales bacterium]|nr:MMPL family transporter [Sedimentisphaerales bacterium]